MSEQQQKEFDEVGVQDIIELMTQEIAKVTREKIVEQAKSKRLVTIIEEARGMIAELDGQVKELTALAQAPKGRKPRAAKPVEDDVPAGPEETVPGELIDE